MAFDIKTTIPTHAHVVSVQVDEDGLYDTVGENYRTVDLKFARVHVSGDGITQAPTYTGAEGLHLNVELSNNTVTIQPE